MSLDDLDRALRATTQLGDWSARYSTSEAHWARRGPDAASGDRLTRQWWAEVHRDSPAGRGSAVFTGPPGTALDAAVATASARAGASAGPAWRSPPAAAPARVTLDDPALGGGALAAAPPRLLEQLVAAGRAAGAAVLDATIETVRDRHEVRTRRGLDVAWSTTRVTVDATLVRDDAPTRIRLDARRIEDLSIGIAVDDAVRAAGRRRAAIATPRGRLPVVLGAGALLHGGRGLFEALVAQADPALERQGLVRYRPGQPIAVGAGATASPLSVTSDGTLAFGLRSAPVDERGDPVRRFELVGQGVARDLALDGREAALRDASPNGGARGLVVAAGSEPEASLLADGPLLIVETWAWLELAPITGRFRAEIGLGQIVDRSGRRDVRGGVVRGDAIAALAGARRSREGHRTPSYRGPATWHLGELTID